MENEREPTSRPTYRTPLRAYERRVREDLSNPGQAALEQLFAQQLRLEQEFAKPGWSDLGVLFQTPGAQAALAAAAHSPLEFLPRHKQGDWGEVPPEDAAENERAVQEGSRIVSAYRTRLDEKVWAITEWDRSATTLLLPEEY